MCKPKFNIIIPSRNRPEYLSYCLSNLDKMVNPIDLNVLVYIVQDCSTRHNLDKIRNINVSVVQFPQKPELFCRAKLLNYGQLAMRKEFDYISIIDNDMIYNPNFFNKIIETVQDNVYFISSGFKLKENITKELLSKKVSLRYAQINDNQIDPDSKRANQRGLYPSQITLNKKTYLKILKILNQKTLYDNGFEGWGGEDSVLSFFSNECLRYELLKKITDRNMWFHLHHPRPWDDGTFNEAQYAKNQRLLKFCKELNNDRLKSYLRGK